MESAVHEAQTHGSFIQGASSRICSQNFFFFTLHPVALKGQKGHHSFQTPEWQIELHLLIGKGLLWPAIATKGIIYSPLWVHCY